jgi:hypothetical protein
MLHSSTFFALTIVIARDQNPLANGWAGFKAHCLADIKDTEIVQRLKGCFSLFNDSTGPSRVEDKGKDAQYTGPHQGHTLNIGATNKTMFKLSRNPTYQVYDHISSTPFCPSPRCLSSCNLVL